MQLDFRLIWLCYSSVFNVNLKDVLGENSVAKGRAEIDSAGNFMLVKEK